MKERALQALVLLAMLTTPDVSPLWGASDGYAGDGAPLAGGATTVFDETRDAFSRPAPNLSEEHRTEFFVGNSFFNQNWIAAPASVSGRDGLGPLFNARSCSACHFKDGRGRPPEPGEPASALLVRISVPGTGAHGGPRPEPVYGDQIQGDALPGVSREADVLVDYVEIPGAFADGTPFSLRQPAYRITAEGYGPIARDVLTSPRVPPAMIGLGLLEAVPASTLTRLADAVDSNKDGISGRVNSVWNPQTRRMDVGRFGWKAEQPSVLLQSAAAFTGDMGITSTIFRLGNHTPSQAPAVKRRSGGDPEISMKVLQSVALYARSLAVPARRRTGDADVIAGEALFNDAGCGSCHVRQMTTGAFPELVEVANQVIQPYTDLLLHDMGDALSDNRPVFGAGGREWRTPPLWGLGLIEKVNKHTFLLHDGRARNVSEAILWHDGEARDARERFRSLPISDRTRLLSFLASL